MALPTRYLLKHTNTIPAPALLYDPSHFVLPTVSNYLEYIDNYHERISMFNVKDAEFNPTGANRVLYGGYQGWVERAGRFAPSAMARWISKEF